MRVLGVTPLYPPHSMVGSWVSTHVCLTEFVRRGHQVTVLQYLTNEKPYELDGVKVVPRDFTLTRWFDDADVVICHLGDNQMASLIAGRRQLPVVRMVHSPQPNASLLLADAALAVFNSVWLAAATRHTCPSIVVPPPVWPEQHSTNPGDRVTLVNLSEAKGGALFWELAEQLPDIEFLGVVGGYGDQLRRDLPNVEILGPQTDMREVWRRSRIVLMPSREESYGRVGLEAMCSGIPVIAHPTTGLRESLGAAGIFLDRGDTDAWARMIRRLIDRPSSWQAASKLARHRVAQLDTGGDLDRLATAIEALAPG